MDLRTLVFAFDVVQVCCAAGLMAMNSSIPGLRGLRWFGWAFLTNTAGMTIGLAMLNGPHVPVVEAWASRTLMLLGGVFLIQGAAMFVAPSANALPWCLGLLGVASTAEVVALAASSNVAGLVITCAVYGGELFFASLLLMSHSEAGERVPSRLTASLLAATGTLALFRAVALPAGWGPPNPYASDAVRFIGFTFFLVCSLGMAFGFVWMATARLRNQLEHQARTDALTGVLNRRAVAALGLEALAECAVRRVPLAVLAIDLDHFKRLNDSHGHAGGDAVLAATARLLSQGLRTTDLVARFGGEEFVAVLPDRDGQRAYQIAERLRSRFEAMTVEHEGANLRVTASFGVATWMPTYGEDPERLSLTWSELLLRADRMLYRAKEDGRNCTRAEWVPDAFATAETVRPAPMVAGGGAAPARATR